jgi:opacity protein-like surface antigen
MGAYSIDYSRESYYEELGVDGKYYDLSNWYETRGDGFDIKLGFICRPFKYSPFRFGISVHTPTWYDLEDVNGATLYYNDEYVHSLNTDPFAYSYRTPWKFGLSIGHTIGNYIAFGAEYEYTDLSTAKYSSNGWNEDVYFRNVNTITQESLKSQNTIKLGLEVKPSQSMSVRVGYNYVSSPYKRDAYRTVLFDSPFTETDFTNWGDINRVTFGLGFRFNGGYLDFAYQYTAQEGDFYAFDDIDLLPTKIENNRNQLLCTLGLRF